MPRTMTAERLAIIRSDNVSDVYVAREGIQEIAKELNAERVVSKALATVLQREVEWASRATVPCARMPEYENARAALAQYAASQPEKEPNLEPR